MSQVASYHITFDNSTHFGEADVEVEYALEENPFDQDEAYYHGEDDAYMPKGRFQFFNIVLTNKTTGLSEEVDEMPDDILNTAKESAHENFEI